MIDSKGVISMNDIINGLKEMDTTTLAILGFAALLLIFLLVLIIITIKGLSPHLFMHYFQFECRQSSHQHRIAQVSFPILPKRISLSVP